MKKGIGSGIKKSFVLLSASTMMLTLSACKKGMEGSYRMTSYKVDREENMTKDIKKLYDKHEIYYGVLEVDKNKKAKLRLTEEEDDRSFKLDEEEEVFIDEDSNELRYTYDEDSGEIKLKGKVDGKRIEMLFERLTDEEIKEYSRHDIEDDREEIQDALVEKVMKDLKGDWTLIRMDGESLEDAAAGSRVAECFIYTNYSITNDKIKVQKLESDGTINTKTYSVKVKPNGIEGRDGNDILPLTYDKESDRLIFKDDEGYELVFGRGLKDLEEAYEAFASTGGIDLGGMVIYIRDWWHPGSVYDMYWYERPEPQSAYEKALQEYQDEVMKKYNFTIYEVGGDDWGMTNYDFAEYVRYGGDDMNYIWTLHSTSEVYDAMKQGLMADLSKIDCLDFSEDKFMRNKLHEKYSIGSSIYAFFSGYSEPRTGVYFNKKILKDAGVDPDSIYEAQMNGTWDWEMFEQIMAKCHDEYSHIYGLTLNESVMTDAAVISNGGSYFKKENGKFVYNVESAETMEALQWCIDIYSKYDNHDPVDDEGYAAPWDYYQTEWRNGQAAFLVEQEYTNVPGNIFENTDFEVGFVMFPKGPRASTCVTIFDNNAFVIPACYVGKDIDKDGHDRAWRIAFAWNAYTGPVPGYEDVNDYLVKAKNGNFDRKALSDTIPMMSEPEHGVLNYSDFIKDISLGPELTWGVGPNANLSELIDNIRDKWKKAVADTNGY